MFGSSRRLAKVQTFQISCAGTVVSRVTLVKYLGVKLDKHLRFTEHVRDMIRKCAGRIGFLYRHSAYLDSRCRKILCNSLLQPYLDYCCMTWYSSLTKDLRNRLDVIQRRMVRFVLDMDCMGHVDSKDLGRLSWLSVPDRVRFFRLTTIFKIHRGIAPGNLSEHFVPTSSNHGHNTRQSTFGFCISRELSMSPKSFAFTAITDWNKLPSSLQCISSLETFKSRLKAYLFASY